MGLSLEYQITLKGCIGSRFLAHAPLCVATSLGLPFSGVLALSSLPEPDAKSSLQGLMSCPFIGACARWPFSGACCSPPVFSACAKLVFRSSWHERACQNFRRLKWRHSPAAASGAWTANIFCIASSTDIYCLPFAFAPRSALGGGSTPCQKRLPASMLKRGKSSRQQNDNRWRLRFTWGKAGLAVSCSSRNSWD